MTGSQAMGVEISQQLGQGQHVAIVSPVLYDLVYARCRTGERHAVRIIGVDARGSVFFDHGRIVHAEFGEDVGLRALVQMLRSPDLQTGECTRRWPSNPSLNLEPKTLFARSSAAREIRGRVNQTAVVKRADVEGVAPVEAVQSANDSAETVEPPPLPKQVLPKPVVPEQQVAPKPVVPEQQVAPKPVVPEQQVAPEQIVEARPALPRFAVRARPSASQIARLRRERLKNVTVTPVPVELATSMVRLSAAGKILAARGNKCEELADAAAYIYDILKLVAGDLNRRGHVSIHLRGGGQSLIVAKSEIKDVAAAVGPTRKLSSLLTKSGLR